MPHLSPPTAVAVLADCQECSGDDSSTAGSGEDLDPTEISNLHLLQVSMVMEKNIHRNSEQLSNSSAPVGKLHGATDVLQQRPVPPVSATAISASGATLEQSGSPKAKINWRKMEEESGKPPALSTADTAFTPEFISFPALRSSIGFGFGILAILALMDWYRFWSLSSNSDAGAAAALIVANRATDERVAQNSAKTKAGESQDLPEWSMLGLVALTSYRFYTGFLSATWLPYLLAMEGADLYTENQSLFMGVAKLIYGLTILTNPLFGLIGDHAVSLSHGVGRRVFLRTGVIIAGLGIFICFLADQYRHFSCFVLGITVWRVGEALNDVTTEALVPELVPQSQYAIASAAKATSFLLGGVSAYLTLIFMTGYHYTWLYWAYGVGMLIFSLPCQALLDNDAPMKGKEGRLRDPFNQLMQKAYIAPAFIEGYFPQLCLGIFIFSFGTSPMFFLLLMIRDLVGTHDPVQLQNHFSASSIVFFISAAVAAVVGGLSDKAKQGEIAGNSNNSTVLGIKDPQVLISRLRSVVNVGVSYAVIAMLLPMVWFFEEHFTRKWAFYSCALLLGYSFGSGFARFQDITWQLIPAGVDVANAMGFNIMCRLFGVGVGNFMAGLLLEFFKYPEQIRTQVDSTQWYNQGDMSRLDVSSPVYRPLGYVVMCATCSIGSLVSSCIVNNIRAGVQRELEYDQSVPVTRVPYTAD